METRLIDLLLRRGRIGVSQSEPLRRDLAARPQAVALALLARGLVGEEDLLNLLHAEYGLPVVRATDLDGVAEADVALVPPSLARRHLLLPLRRQGSRLVVAMADPTDFAALQEIRFLTGLEVETVLAPAAALAAAIERHHETRAPYEQVLDAVGEADAEAVAEDEPGPGPWMPAGEEAPVVRLVQAILHSAVRREASDIHLEPLERACRVRLRVDGMLEEIVCPPGRLRHAITSRLKVMASLDIAERRLPQDGRLQVPVPERGVVEFRVSVLPTLHGEKVALRLLDRSRLELDPARLGFSEEQRRQFTTAIQRPHGMVLVTGPTGSGKTTTLYSALRELNDITRNISTAEDPVEFQLPGVNQVQVRDDIGLGFASVLRAFLRQDPDVLMVGEIRDVETAGIAVKAALTGHLVLSTLHTNDAVATIARLLDMGVEPFLVASSLQLVVAQRLLRRLCDGCRVRVQVAEPVLREAGLPAAEAARVEAWEGKGCVRCHGSGFRGRQAVYEMLPVGGELRERIAAGATLPDLRRQAGALGLTTLRRSALAQFTAGQTSLAEVLRVTAPDEPVAPFREGRG